MTPCATFGDATLFLATQLASLAAIGVSAWIFGETVLRRFEMPGRGRWALSGALGWGLILQSLYALGLVGLLERWVALGLLASAHLLCWRTWRSLAECRCRLGLAALGGVILAPFVGLTFYPPTGFDATVYHLPYARAFVEAGGLAFLADLRFPIFPQAGEMGFVLGLFLSGEIAAKLTQLLAMILAAGLVHEWGRLYSRQAGLWAAALWLGNPLVVWLGTSAYVDVTLALFVAAALFSWERWSRDDDRRWLWLAGAFAGLAAGTKYLGLFFVAALAGLTVLQSLMPRPGRARGARSLATLIAIALVVLAPWYLRIVYHTGNPVFPFYAPIFGQSEWASLHDQALPAAGSEAGAIAFGAVAWSQLSRIAEGLSFLARVPWTAVFDRGLFHWQAPLSPYYLLLVPLCGPLALLERHTRRWMVVVAVYALFWLSTVRDLRFLVAAVPALNVALAATLGRSGLLAGIDLRRHRVKSVVTPLLTVLLLAPGVAYAGYKLHERGWPPVGAAQRTAYLIRQVPGFRAIAMMNQLEGRDYTVYALYGENLRYYANGRFLGDWFGPARFSRIEAVLGDSRALAGELERLGACFFLLRHVRPRELMPADPFFREHFLEQAVGADFALYRLAEVSCSRQAH